MLKEKGATLYDLICPICKKDFQRSASKLNYAKRRGEPITCSKSCGGKHSHQKRNGKATSPLAYTVNNCKSTRSAKTKEMNITAEYLETVWEQQEGRCALTGLKMELRQYSNRSEAMKPNSSSLDRIDNEIGYVEGNVQFTCVSANHARNIFSIEEIREWFLQIKNSGGLNE